MIDVSSSSRHWWVIVKTFALIVAFGLLLSSDVNNAEEARIRLLLHELSDAGVFGGGRLTGMPLPGARFERFARAARLEGILPSGAADTPQKRRILSLVYALEGQFAKAEEELRRLALQQPNDPSLKNDLGVMRMGLALSDPTSWIVAGQYFEAALAQQPNFPEAEFNLILTYRHLGLRKAEASLIADYKKLEHESAWRSFVEDSRKSLTGNSLAQRILDAPSDEISDFVKNDPSSARQIVLTFAFQPAFPIPSGYEQVAYELAAQYGDDTAKLAIGALLTTDLDRIVHIRQLLTQERELYLQGRYAESRNICDTTRALARQTHSLFDQLWVEVSEADISAVLFDWKQAAKTYLSVAETARRNNAQWILARALASLGSAPALSGGFAKTIAHLNEAITIYRSIGETTEIARPLYYLASDHFIAESYGDGLKFAIEALNAAAPSDHLRLTQLCFAVSGALFTRGFERMAIRFGEEAMNEAEKLGSPLYLTRMRMQLASMYLAAGSYSRAIGQIEISETLLKQLNKKDRDIANIIDKLLRGRISLVSGNLSGAEIQFRDTLALFSKYQDDALISYRLQTEMLYTTVLQALGKTQVAEQELHNAIDLVETGQNKLSDDNLQLTFDADRRDVYEAAINFEFNRGNCEEAWHLSQGYKAKLFLSQLAKSASASASASRVRMSLRDVQQLIPNSTGILDYVTLKDKLLVWGISKHSFHCRSTPVDAQELQERIDTFNSLIAQKRSVTQYSRDLYELLVQPIRDSIEAVHTFVVIPDRHLYRIPFAALQSGRSGRYWVETASLLESPSLTYFLSHYDATISKKGHVAFGSRTYDFPTEIELEKIKEIDPDIRSYSGAAVTREVFLDALRNSSVVYYVGHAAFDLTNALQSSILLDAGRPGPNAISALEIMDQQIARNSTVILSSCETSLGNSIDGAGLGGLTSAFLSGGAGSVVGSIWQVESSSTTKLISSMFRSFLRDRRSIVASLRYAQMQMIQDSKYNHPYYWSGFNVTGDQSALALLE